MSESKVSIKGLYKIFGPKPKSVIPLVEQGVGKKDLLDEHRHVLGLNDVNIEIESRQIQVIMGLSGSGKSTLIRHINRLIEPTIGKVLVDGEDVLAMNDNELRDFRRFKASMVFQKFGLLPHRTVVENVQYGLKIQGIKVEESGERAQKWIDRVGLTGFETHYPAQLSGGMQQRVGLARALATDAEILLMDEAFSALDPLIRTDMQDVLLDLQEELHKTIIFITHDLDEALHIGDSIVILRDGGVVQQADPQHIILEPADEYVADFIQDINRARVLLVNSVMEEGHASNDTAMGPRTKLEEALQILNQAAVSEANVVDGGKQLGRVTIDKVIAAIARPEAMKKDVAYR